MDARRTLYSRFQILTQGEPAWVAGPNHGSYFFDGFRFWQLSRSRPAKLLVSWRTPSFGWEHSDDCLCPLCTGAFIGAAAPTPSTPQHRQMRLSA